MTIAKECFSCGDETADTSPCPCFECKTHHVVCIACMNATLQSGAIRYDSAKGFWLESCSLPFGIGRVIEEAGK